MSTAAFFPARTTHVPGTPDGVVPFIGRKDVLRAASMRLDAGRGTVVTGPTGVGKTRTLQAVMEAAHRAGRSTERLIATRSTASVPFGAFLGLLPMELMEQAVQTSDLDRALIVRSGILSLGLDVLGVDDAQLLDDESAALLLDLARTGTTVVLALDRGVPVPDALVPLPDIAGAETIELAPFTLDESRALTEAVLQGSVDSGTVVALHVASRGIPLALRELLHVLTSTGRIARSGDLWSLTEEVTTTDPLDTTVLDRLAALDLATRAWVDLVATAGRVPVDLADTLAHDEAADRAEVDGWVRIDERYRAYVLADPAVAQPITDRLGSRARQRLLESVVDGLSGIARPLLDEERVLVGRWRLDLGAELTTDEALDLAFSTSPEDPALAERFLRRAAADGEAFALTALAQHLIATGRLPEAEQLLQTARETGGAEVRVAALLALAVGIGDRRSAEALQDLDRALVDHPGEADLLAVQVALYVAESRSEDASLLALRIAELSGAGAGVVLGEVYGAVALASRGDRAGANRMTEHLQSLAEQNVRALPEGPMLQAWLGAAVPWAVSRDVRTTTEIAQRGYDQSLRAGLRPDRARFAHLLAAGRLVQGDAVLAVRLLREAEAAPCFWRDSRRPEIVAELVEALVLAGQQGDAERAFERLDVLRRTPEQDADHALARAALAMGRGDLQEAATIALEIGNAAADRGERAAASDAWIAAMRYGSIDAARRLLGQADNPAGAVRDLVRAHAAAVVEHDPAALVDVAETYWRSGVRLYAMESSATAARWHLDAGDTIDATATTELLLRWAVSTPGLSDPLAEPVPLAGLTSREQEIVRLAASGLTDRDIAVDIGISLRTAQTHLSRAFNKLGVHRRQELVRLIPEHRGRDSMADEQPLA